MFLDKNFFLTNLKIKEQLTFPVWHKKYSNAVAASKTLLADSQKKR